MPKQRGVRPMDGEDGRSTLGDRQPGRHPPVRVDEIGPGVELVAQPPCVRRARVRRAPASRQGVGAPVCIVPR